MGAHGAVVHEEVGIITDAIRWAMNSSQAAPKPRIFASWRCHRAGGVVQQEIFGLRSSRGLGELGRPFAALLDMSVVAVGTKLVHHTDGVQILLHHQVHIIGGALQDEERIMHPCS